jgi:hypothetical protein
LELLLQQQVRLPPEGQIRPSKGLIAKFVQSKDLTIPNPSLVKSGDRKTETPANDRGRFLYLYFQCSEVGRAKWHISEECFCRGFKLNRCSRGRYEIDADEKATYEGPIRLVNECIGDLSSVESYNWREERLPGLRVVCFGRFWVRGLPFPNARHLRHPFQWKNTLPWYLGPAAKVRILRFKNLPPFRHYRGLQNRV